MFPSWVCGSLVLQVLAHMCGQPGHEGCPRSDDVSIKWNNARDGKGIVCLTQHLSSDLQHHVKHVCECSMLWLVVLS